MQKRVVAELRRIAKANGGLVHPEAVVDSARPKSSPLHSRFEWDDGEAGHQYRLWQARQLIRVVVDLLPGTDTQTEVFVSLKSDRRHGGYRVVAEVLSDRQLREQMLRDALDELEFFRDKYKSLRELAEVFAAIKKARR